MEIQQPPRLTWISGTAFDLFISLYVLHHPDRFGLRASWAAGVRSRLPQAEREFLENAQSFLTAPLLWLCSIGEDRSALAALRELATIPAGERLAVLTRNIDASPEFLAVIRKIQEQGTYTAEDVQVVTQDLARRSISQRPPAILELCKAWSQAEAFGENYLKALNSYYSVFFEEEERRIQPALAAVKQALGLA